MNKIWALLFSILLLSGCNTAHKNVDYFKPKVATDNKAATIIGSRTENGAFVADEVLYVLAIDGKPIESAEENSVKPLRIEPGNHTIQVAFAQGKLHAQVTFKSSLNAGEIYEVKAQKNALESVTFWISEKSSNTVVTEKLVGKVISGELAPMFIPIMVN